MLNSYGKRMDGYNDKKSISKMAIMKRHKP
jgi:hypothetical protein